MSRRPVARPAALVAAGLLAVSVLGTSVGFSSASFTSTSQNTATVRAAADWTPPTVALSPPGAQVSGVVALAATAADGETEVASVAVQRRSTGGPGWTAICTAAATPFRCTWDTTTVPDGEVELRAVAVDGTGLTATTAPVTTVVVNGVGVTLTDPGGPVRGTVPLTASLTGSPAGAPGAWSVRFEYAVAGSASWQQLCTDPSAPYTCAWVTTGLGTGQYDLRAVAWSGSATRVSPVVGDVLVDNTSPEVTITDPGSPLRGTVTFEATARDTGSGVERVVFQHAPSGSATYRDLCTADAEPFSCAFPTSQLPDGASSFRAVATDRAGNSATSAVVGDRQVDNGALRAVDVQTANGEGAARRLDAGDTVTFTFSRPVRTTSLLPGWDGSPTPVSVRLSDGLLVGGSGEHDVLDVQHPGGAVHLGVVDLRENYVSTRDVVLHDATMTAATTTVDGVGATVVTVTVGARTEGSTRTVPRATTLVWTPSTAVVDLAGRPCSPVPATESGAEDEEF